MRVAVVHGTKRVREVVEAVLAGDKSFDLIEVMVLCLPLLTFLGSSFLTGL